MHCIGKILRKKLLVSSVDCNKNLRANKQIMKIKYIIQLTDDCETTSENLHRASNVPPIELPVDDKMKGLLSCVYKNMLYH